MTLIETLARTPDLRAMPQEGAAIATALRLWIMARSAPCRFQVVADRLGSERAAAHFHLLLEEIGTAWPEPFCVSPPCCRRLSHDEALLANMVGIAGSGDRPAFDRLLSDLVPGEVRDRLYLSSLMVSRAMVVRAHNVRSN